MHKENTSPQLPLGAYDIFILFTTGLALIDLFVIAFPFFNTSMKEIAIPLDLFFSVLFILDFFYCLFRAQDKRVYLLKWGWLDFLGCLPYFSILRLFRLHRAIRIIRALRQRNLKEVEQVLRKYPERTTFFTITLIAIILVTVASYVVLRFEEFSPKSNIQSASDALWWSIVTITTVGYGDRVPTTNGGRIMAGLLMFVGIGIFSALTSYLSAAFINRPANARKKHRGNEDLHRRLDAIEQQLKDLSTLIENEHLSDD